MNATKEITVRTAAAKHLTGLPARHNALRLAELQDILALEELHARFGEEEVERCNRLANAESVEL